MKQFKQCIDCKRSMVHIDPATQKQTATKSKYPYCLGCYMRRGEDPNFQSWVARKLEKLGLKIQS